MAKKRAAIVAGTAMLWLIAPARVQAQGELLEVTYLEVAPSSESSAVALLERYRSGSRTDPGNIGLELLQQAGRPGHFVILESWRDQTSFDRHKTMQTTTGLFEALQPLRVSALDQRLFKGLTARAAAPSPAARTIYVVTHVDTIPDPRRDAMALLKRLGDDSRREDGNLAFDLFQHVNRLNHFTIVEMWKDRGALDRHAVATHTRQFREEIQPALGSPIDERLFTAVR